MQALNLQPHRKAKYVLFTVIMSSKNKSDAIVHVALTDSASDLAPDPVGSSFPSEFEGQPDGGLEGWFQVFACWLLFLNTWFVSQTPVSIYLVEY